MKSRQIVKLEARDYREAKRAIEKVEEELELKGRNAKDIVISFRKEEPKPPKE